MTELRAVAAAPANARAVAPAPASDSSGSHTVVFTPSGLSGAVADGTTVLDAAVQLGADLDTVCGGRGICGRCQIKPSTGEFAKWAITVDDRALSPWGLLEESYAGKRAIVEGRRLGCSAKICGNIVIDIPPESQIHKQVIRKTVDVGELVIDPIYSLHYLTDVAEAGGIAQALDAQWGVTLNGPRRTVALDNFRSNITVALERRSGGTSVAAFWPGYIDRLMGVAVDVGSTTIAGHLIDLANGEVLSTAGQMNPQIRFGEDLMSRVSYVMMNPGGEAELTKEVRAALNQIVTELCETAGIERSRIVDVTLVGNPIMHHLVLGLDPTPLGQSPFPLAIEGAFAATAAHIELDLPNATLYVAPCIAGHVGADTAAAILNEGPHRSDAIQLLVDVGTNAEIVLGNSQQLFACSSPTGPAFEGAQISSGQRATAGAIERVAIDRDTYDVIFKVIGSDLWSNEIGFSAEIDASGITGICGSGIIEAISEMVSAGIIDHSGVIRGELATDTDRIVEDGRTYNFLLVADIFVTQADVRAIQLAKAALKAGIDLLMEHAGLSAVDEIRLAGAFGAHIDPTHAMVVGLIPEIDVANVHAVGNSAGSGAVRLLLSAEQRTQVEAVVQDVIKIETATEPRFQEHFVTALGFPRSTAPKAAHEGGRRRRSRRR
jgi:uncharacterized 2Fe-2S/4Fe-4S cluster protein (DUF4445 family)